MLSFVQRDALPPEAAHLLLLPDSALNQLSCSDIGAAQLRSSLCVLVGGAQPGRLAAMLLAFRNTLVADGTLRELSPISQVSGKKKPSSVAIHKKSSSAKECSKTLF